MKALAASTETLGPSSNFPCTFCEIHRTTDNKILFTPIVAAMRRNRNGINNDDNNEVNVYNFFDEIQEIDVDDAEKVFSDLLVTTETYLSRMQESLGRINRTQWRVKAKSLISYLNLPDFFKKVCLDLMHTAYENFITKRVVSILVSAVFKALDPVSYKQIIEHKKGIDVFLGTVKFIEE